MTSMGTIDGAFFLRNSHAEGLPSGDHYVHLNNIFEKNVLMAFDDAYNFSQLSAMARSTVYSSKEAVECAFNKFANGCIALVNDKMYVKFSKHNIQVRSTLKLDFTYITSNNELAYYPFDSLIARCRMMGFWDTVYDITMDKHILYSQNRGKYVTGRIPGTGPTLNLFTGFTASLNDMTCGYRSLHFTNYIKEELANFNDDHVNWIINWFATVVKCKETNSHMPVFYGNVAPVRAFLQYFAKYVIGTHNCAMVGKVPVDTTNKRLVIFEEASNGDEARATYDGIFNGIVLLPLDDKKTVENAFDSRNFKCFRIPLIHQNEKVTNDNKKYSTLLDPDYIHDTLAHDSLLTYLTNYQLP